ncbi:inosamine-phosphate amidinotransferase 1 [Streptomyces erythrochromogenes]|uniref:inosamine-phosphate amidinotransferase 1 n=1 Tax=Streptomyces erythrochromogenes TaxID=285574 RepID=UPI0036355FA4
MSIVSVHTEWDALEEVVIGTLTAGRTPTGDRSLLAVEFADLPAPEDVPSGPFPADIVAETNDELNEVCAELTSLGIKVRRPQERDTAATFATPDWHADGFYDYCPRDVLLTVGDTVIETPMVLRSRFLEPFAYRSMLIEFLRSGSRWLSAPKPQLLDELYDLQAPAGRRLRDLEPAFDAANVLKFGTDILYLVSDTGNELGALWLQSVLGKRYTVHPCRGIYASSHVDSTIVPLRPGLVLLNPERVNDENMPELLQGWDHLWCPELAEIGYHGGRPRCSNWIGMNLLVIRPNLVMADDRQPALIRALEAHGVDVVPKRLTHARSLGGGFHCVSLDVRRAGPLESYRR